MRAEPAREGGAGATRTRFATRTGTDGTVRLTLADEPADHTNIDRYFDGGVDDYLLTPWTDANIWPPMDAGSWRERPIVNVDPTGMLRTQKRVLKKHLARAAACAEPEGGDVPWIIVFDSRSYVVDGHHRIVNAVHNSHQTVPVHVLDLDELYR